MFFERVFIIAQIADTDELSTTLSASSVVLLLSALCLLEDRKNWDEMSDGEWDEIEAYCGNIAKEIIV